MTVRCVRCKPDLPCGWELACGVRFQRYAEFNLAYGGMLVVEIGAIRGTNDKWSIFSEMPLSELRR